MTDWPRSEGIGALELVYRYTVTGSDKASIDTGSDASEAGTNDWADGDVLEVMLYARTDEAVGVSAVNVTLNNDTGSNYDRVEVKDSNVTVTGASANASAWAPQFPGDSAVANDFSTAWFLFPNYTGTVGHKSGVASEGMYDTTAANARQAVWQLRYRSTSAITRIAATPNTAGKKFKVGSQLLVYKRRSK